MPLRVGGEEYIDSEKYEVKERRLEGPLLPLIAKLTRPAREPGAAAVDNLLFLETANESLIAYAKQEAGNTALVCVNLDPRVTREGLLTVPDSLGLGTAFAATDAPPNREALQLGRPAGTTWDWGRGSHTCSASID